MHALPHPEYHIECGPGARSQEYICWIPVPHTIGTEDRRKKHMRDTQQNRALEEKNNNNNTHMKQDKKTFRIIIGLLLYSLVDGRDRTIWSRRMPERA